MINKIVDDATGGYFMGKLMGLEKCIVLINSSNFDATPMKLSSFLKTKIVMFRNNSLRFCRFDGKNNK